MLDKTGTLTRGEPEVVAVATADGVDENEVLRLVAAAERDSEHPLAEAIVKAASARSLRVPRTEAFEAVPGHGLLASVDGHRLAVGNARLLGARRASHVTALPAARTSWRVRAARACRSRSTARLRP